MKRPEWTTALPDWRERIVAGQSLLPCAPLFPSASAQGIQVFDSLQIVDANTTFGKSRPWIRDFASVLFGSYCDVPGHPDEGRRLIRTFFMLISKKNTKSTLAAGIMLTALILNWRQEAEYIIISPTKEIADNSFRPIRAAIEADHELASIFHIQVHERKITHRATNATLKVVAADSQTVTGKKATGVLVDELHEFGKKSGAEDMLVEATGGLMSRPEGFVIYLTTQSSDQPAGIFKKELEYSRAVRDGRIVDNTYLPILYEYPEKYLDPRTKLYLRPENWYITNPNMGITVDEEILANKIKKATETGQDSLQSVVSKHLNVQIGLDLGADRWPGAEFWERTRTYGSLSRFRVDCEVVTCGIDGGGLDDLLALTFTGRLKGGKGFFSWSHAWAHPSVLERRKEIEPRLRDFEAAGDLTIVEKAGDDVAELAAMVAQMQATGLLHAIGIDPARIASIVSALTEVGIQTDNPEVLVKIRQGWSLYSAMLWMERLLAEGRYTHANQPLVDWSVGNAKVVPRGNAMLVTKEVSGKAKIDLVMSSFNAGELMSYNPPSRSGGYSLDALGVMG